MRSTNPSCPPHACASARVRLSSGPLLSAGPLPRLHVGLRTGLLAAALAALPAMPRAAQAASAVAATPATPVIPATPAAKRTPAAQPRPGARAARAAPAKAASATAAAAAGSVWPASLISARAEQVFGPLQVDSDGVATMREPRHLRLPDTSRERADLPAGTRLRLSAAHRVRESGQPHDVMLWHGERREGAEGGGFQDEVAVLAVFRAGEAAPTDVAEVKTDRMTYFAEPAVRPLGAQDDLFDLVNHHANAGQPYAEHSLYHLRAGRLRRIVQVDLLGEFSGCAKSFDQAIAWRTEPDAAQPLPRIVAEVTLRLAPLVHTEQCRPRPAPRRQLYSARFRWDAAADRYRAEPGGTLDRLARWNESRQ